MAHTAHRDARMLEEIETSPEKLQQQAREAAGLIRAAHHIVVFTGAGISTSAGIPDYRGPEGVWTLAAQSRERTAPVTPMDAATPTYTHMALVKLFEMGKLKQVISQNVDGLHRKSGIPQTGISELHGNTHLEECDTCGKLVARELHIHGNERHYTGRCCCAEGGCLTADGKRPRALSQPAGGTGNEHEAHGRMRDTIINFGENLSAAVLERAFEHSREADLHICMGSSLTVSPACDLPRETRSCGGKVIIVNLQRTPLDGTCCDLRVHAKTDDFMRLVMTELGWQPPKFVLRCDVSLWQSRDPETHRSALRVGAVYPSTNIPMTAFAKLRVFATPVQVGMSDLFTTIDSDSSTASSKDAAVVVAQGTPLAACVAKMEAIGAIDYTVDASTMNNVCPHFNVDAPRAAVIELEPLKHYHEPTLQLPFPAETEAVSYTASWTVGGGEPTWRVVCTGYTAAVIAPNDMLSKLPRATLPDLARGSGTRRQGGESHNATRRTMPNADHSGWFAVTPLRSCPHTVESNPEAPRFAPGMTFDVKRPCHECGNVGENMMCLTCGIVACGRHVSSHMMRHHEQQPSHHVVAGFADLSFWCYECEAYIDNQNRTIAPFFRLLHRAKFDEGVAGDDATPAEVTATVITPPPPAVVQRIQQAYDSVTPWAPGGWFDRAAAFFGLGARGELPPHGSAASPPEPAVAAAPTKTVEKAVALMYGVGQGGGFQVEPLRTCPHCDLVPTESQAATSPAPRVYDVHARCHACDNVGENMMCVTCGIVACGRHVHGHMVQHHDANPTHHIVAGFADLSFWCYACDSYISERQARLRTIYEALCVSKFL